MFRLEFLPILLGALVALVGIGLAADAWLPDGTMVPVERRRRPRAERNLRGEAMIGIGVVLLGAALMGRDSWRYGTIAVMLGTALILVGAVMNRSFLHERFAFRGPARRTLGGNPPRERVKPAPPPTRAEPQERRKSPR